MRIFVEHETKKKEIMTKQDNTIEEILNSKLLNDMIKQEDEDLKAAGWTYEEVRAVANMVINKQ